MITDREAPSTRPSAREEFAELSRRVRDAGLLERRRGYYTAKIGITAVALGALATAALMIGNSWWILVVAAGLAFVLTQVSFIAHDAGHRQIAVRRRTNDLIGLVHGNLLSGFSFGWWLTKHTRHHANTNRADKDPDLVPGALVYTPDQAAQRGPLARRFARAQAVYLVPLLFLEALNLHVASIRSLVRRRDRAALVEVSLLIAHGALFFALPFLVLSPLRAVVFIAVTQSLLGFLLGASFLPNHVGMPTVDGTEDLGFLRRQVLTSRNLSGRTLTTFLYGGLDAQIEHHLFPAMPRVNLRRARALVRPYCAEHGISYAEPSPWRAYADIARHLRVVGAAAVVPTVG